MAIRDMMIAVLVAVVWGLSFIAIKLGVDEMPPLMFSALRFALAALPAVFFIPAPKTSFWIVTAYGFAIGVAQFGLLFIAIRLGMPAGLSSLVIQLQVFFTIVLAWFSLGERPFASQILGSLIGFAGVAVIGSERLGGAQLLPFLLVIAAALCWGAGNLIGKRAGQVDMLAFTIWSSLVAPLPLVALSAWFEGTSGFVALMHPSLTVWGSAAILAYAATLFGYGAWAHLLSRYPAAAVTPFALLVPVSGLASARVVFGEPTSPVELIGAGLVLAGLACTVWGRRLAWLISRPPPVS